MRSCLPRIRAARSGRRGNAYRRRGLALIDAILGGLLIAIGIGTIMSLTARSVREQARGEKRVVASWLADELLSMVIVEGPVEYTRVQDASGIYSPPFDDFEFEVQIEETGRNAPYRVTAYVRWGSRDDQYVALETLVAERRGEEPNEEREPEEELDRESRYYDDEDEGL